ncbi:hypothetical protein Pcinc_015585 [Petrolisthes cinctipes]|uniref:Transmembrane protein 135 N-terminal domain-containing protein n=1 Tax=Petrolisthes cinctipes TaxID=88211 RepID=A0AAE1FU50_PETCI|nr:hypothetical protein Pcinc_015585 [Petrolisthes cinctipes]
MANLSKLLNYSCYELGHCFNHSCSGACFEICIIAFIESCKIYGVVYLATLLVNSGKMSISYARKILKDYLTSACFLTVNGFGYIGSFCLLKHILGHINFFTASYVPGFLASLAAIFVERPERRPLLAIYCLNVASESLWNNLANHGYVRNIPRGEVIIFSLSMAVLGYFFRSPRPASRFIHSILQLILGKGETGAMISERKAASSVALPQHHSSPRSWIKRLLFPLTVRHHFCPHKAGCLPHFVLNAMQGFMKGYVLQLGLRVLPSVPSFLSQPWKIVPIVLSRTNIQAGFFFAWFTAVFKGTCCVGRWWMGREVAGQGAVAGALAALSMYWYSAPSMALYIMWKILETLYKKGCDADYLPRIPGSVEILYAIAVGYLFHIAVMEKHYLKPSYWRFLNRLTWSHIAKYNRHLLEPYGLSSAREFANFWPQYNLNHISENMRQMTIEHLAKIQV